VFFTRNSVRVALTSDQGLDSINPMNTATTKNKIAVPKAEYLRLKKLEGRFHDFWAYMEHIIDVRMAREEVRNKQVIPQEKLFNRLGL